LIAPVGRLAAVTVCRP